MPASSSGTFHPYTNAIHGGPWYGKPRPEYFETPMFEVLLHETIELSRPDALDVLERALSSDIPELVSRKRSAETSFGLAAST